MSTTQSDHQQKHQSLLLGNHNDWELLVNSTRVLLRHRRLVGCDRNDNVKDDDDGTTGSTNTTNLSILSSVVLNGGLQKVQVSKNNNVQILNAKVPAGYDGINPNPVEWLQQLAKQQQQQQQRDTTNRDTPPPPTTTTIGLMTSASMETLRVFTQRASTATAGGGTEEVIVDAIVTAGISNSRIAGADADCFFFSTTNTTSDDEKKSTTKSSSDSNTAHPPAPPPPPPGTINTIIVTNASITDTTLVEAYSVACEAKTRALQNLGIVCAKTGQIAQGTGTDSTVLVANAKNAKTKTKEQIQKQQQQQLVLVDYAGKHTLFGELIGLAVYQATREAIVANIQQQYGYCGYGLYRLCCWYHQCRLAIQHGHCPLIPSQPTKPIPRPSGLLLFLGITGVLSSYLLHYFCCCYNNYYGSSSGTTATSILLAVTIWDRFLGGSILLPVSFHPVVLIGNVITVGLSWIPQSCFSHPIHGLVSGSLLFGITLLVCLGTAWGIYYYVGTKLLMDNYLIDNDHVDENGTTIGIDSMCIIWIDFVPWFLQVYLLQSAISLQLLCNIALQMGHFLERRQLKQARVQLSWLCSRDPSNLTTDELAGATLESLAENLGDGVVSPLFYYVLFGPLGAFGFKIINTLDSRVGYRGRFEWVGKPSARCDDLLNLIPARLTAVLLVAAAFLLKHVVPAGIYKTKYGHRTHPGQGLKVAWRDASQCDSPNAGWPMSTMAGILNVCLEKREHYSLNPAKFGGKSPGYNDIRAGHAIAQLAGLLAICSACLVVGFRQNTNF